MVQSLNNFFELPHPKRYGCEVSKYSLNRYTLTIKAQSLDQNTTYYLHFMGVIYMRGPLNWIGAEFYVADDALCTKIRRQTLDFGTRDTSPIQGYSLYVNIPANATDTTQAFSVMSSMTYLEQKSTI